MLIVGVCRVKCAKHETLNSVIWGFRLFGDGNIKGKNRHEKFSRVFLNLERHKQRFPFFSVKLLVPEIAVSFLETAQENVQVPSSSPKTDFQPKS